MTLEEVWNMPANTPSSTTAESLAAGARAELRRAQRRRARFVALTGLALLGTSALFVFIGTKPGEAAGIGPMLVLLAAQWSAFALFARQMWTARASVAPSIRASLEALWSETERRRRGHNAILSLYALATPLLAAALLQLRAAGKMAPHEALSAAAVFALVIGGGTIAILLHRHLRLRPRRRQLEALLAQYRGE